MVKHTCPRYSRSPNLPFPRPLQCSTNGTPDQSKHSNAKLVFENIEWLVARWRNGGRWMSMFFYASIVRARTDFGRVIFLLKKVGRVFRRCRTYAVRGKRPITQTKSAQWSILRVVGYALSRFVLVRCCRVNPTHLAPCLFARQVIIGFHVQGELAVRYYHRWNLEGELLWT